MKDSSRADAEFIDTACHDPEFISAPSLPRPRGICHRVKLPRPENHRRSFPRISTAIPQMVITGGPPVIPDLFADPVITTRNVTRRGSFIPSPLPPKRRREIYRHRFLRLGIYRCRFPRPGIYWCWFSGGGTQFIGTGTKFNRYVYRYLALENSRPISGEKTS